MFKAGLVKVFREDRAQSLPLRRISEYINRDHRDEPFTPVEVDAAIIRLDALNQVMMSDNIVFLI